MKLRQLLLSATANRSPELENSMVDVYQGLVIRATRTDSRKEVAEEEYSSGSSLLTDTEVGY